MPSKGKAILLAATAIAFAVVLATGASAAPITIGRLPGATPPAICMNDIDHFEVGVGSGADYRVPSGYTEITSWSTYAAFGAGQEMALKVYDEQSSTQYVVISEDGPRELSSGDLNTFPVEIPVAPGDVIGDNSANAATITNACSFFTGVTGDVMATAVPGVGVHLTGMFKTAPEYLTNVTVTVEAPPVLTLISPSSGSVAGGTSITLAGHDLTGAKSVQFGGESASFKVTSDNEIKATTPAVSATGAVDVTVTTAAGTTAKVAGGRFAYAPASSGGQPGVLPTPVGRHCVVPKLKGKKLKAVRKALTKADCKLGKVSGPKGKRATVKKQGSKAGSKLAAGSKIAVKLGSA